MSSKKVLLSSYGGSHGKIIKRVASILEKRGIEFFILAPPASFHDFASVFPDKVITFRTELKKPQIPTSFFPLFEEIFLASLGKKELEEESYYYLGHSFLDTLKLLEEGSFFSYFSYLNLPHKFISSEDYLKNLWKKYKRQFLLPLMSVEKIVKKIKPDLIITTNSPRMERALLLVGEKLGIETLAIIDGFGNTEQYPLRADHIVVPSSLAKKRIIEKGGGASYFHIWGSPLWEDLAEVEAIFSEKDFYLVLIVFSPYEYDKEAFLNLLDIGCFLSSKEGLRVYLKTHPHDCEGENFIKKSLLPKKFNIYLIHREKNIYPYLKASDLVIVSHSTAGIEARILGRKVIVSTFESLLAPLKELGFIFLLPQEVKEKFEEIQGLKSKSVSFNLNFTDKFSVFLEKRGF